MTNAKYNYNNTAEEINRQLNEAPRKVISNSARRNRERATRINPALLIFFVIALCFFTFTLVNYIRELSDVTSSISTISTLENRYQTLKADNEEEYLRILSEVDMDEIKRVATEELGMHYAKEGQIYTYADEKNDYVRQYSDIE